MTNRHSLRTALALISLGLPASALAQTDRIGGGYYDHMWSGGWGVMGAGSMILFWVLIIALIVVAVRWLSQQSSTGAHSSGGALKTLEERLAKGEIDVAEFDDRKKALNS